ncbi:MAG: hypothetical protein ACI4W2_04810 [Eubacterium sp.]
MSKKAPNDDIIQLTQIGIERRRTLAEKERHDRRSRRQEITSAILTLAGITSCLGACFAGETSTRTLAIGALIGFALIGIAAIIDIINLRESR